METPSLDEDKCSTYIVSRLLKEKSLFLEKDLVKTILQYETDFMVENGLAEYVD